MGKTFVKRAYSFLLACVMVLAMFPATSLATEVDTSDPDFCPHCGQIATWTEITTIGSTTNTGHYRLKQDYTAGGVRTIGAAADVVIDLAGSDITAKTNTRLFTVYGGLSILDTSAEKTGELIASDISANTGNNGYGACVYLSKSGDYGTFNLYGGTIRGGKALRGGNIYIVNGEANIYNGTVKDGIATQMGANICLYTGNSSLNVYGGAITQTGAHANAKNFGNITNYDGVVNVYDGTISDTRTGAKSIHSSGTTSEFNVYGGTLTSSIGWHGVVGVTVYNGNISGQDPSGFLAACAEYCKQGDTYVVWHTMPSPCKNSTCYYDENLNNITTNSGIAHTIPSGSTTCANCNTVVAKVGTVSYTKLEDALDAATAGSTVTLTGNCKVSNIEITDITLDLAGNMLAADTVDASLGNIIDSTNGDGWLICPQNSTSVAFNGTNKHLPIKAAGGYRFTAVTLKQRIYALENGTVRFKFSFGETADETLLAEVLANGSTGTNISIKVRVSWIRNGVENEETYVVASEEVARYAAAWDTGEFDLSFSGHAGVTSLTCTPVVASTPIDGLQTEVAISGVAAQGVMAEVKNPLTLEEIEQFDTARENLIEIMGTMTEEDRIVALRQHCIDFMQFTKQALWTPKSDRYFNLDSKTPDSLDVGTVYGGLPYVSNATGNLYRLLDYIDENGVLDTEAATQSMLQFGTMCSSGVYAGWGRVINSIKGSWTENMTEANGFYRVGDYTYDPELLSQNSDLNTLDWHEDYNTETVVNSNGWSVMVESYAKLQPGDGCVYYAPTESGTMFGHVVMIVDVHEVRNAASGNIDGNASYVTILEQTKPWTEGTKTGANGTDTYLYKDLDTTLTFNQLYVKKYVPFTFAEFLPSSDSRHQAVEETTYTITPPSGSSLDKDVITISDFWGATVEANYGILDIYVTITDPNTNEELYWYAYRPRFANTMAQALYPTSANAVTRGAIPTYTGETQYPIKIEVQLSTGERPVLYEGLLQR